MRRPARVLLSALFSALALGLLVYALGDGEQLVSLSYLEERFLPELVEQGSQAAREGLEESYQQALGSLGEEQEGSGAWMDYEVKRGDALELQAGSGFLFREGAAQVSHSGAWIDVTQGREVHDGAALTPGHRYLCGEETRAVVRIRSGLARCAAQGAYHWEEGEEPAAPFTDVALPDWYVQAVDFAYFQGLFAGMGDDTFAPGAQMDRAMMMTVLYHLASSPEEERLAAQPAFLDVPSERWYSSFINWAYARGISAGTGDQYFSPELPVTREQVVVLLHNFALNHLHLELEEYQELSAFGDQEQVAFWSYDAMAWAVGCGVIGGGADALLEPTRPATRAEAASMLMMFSRRYLEVSPEG